MHYLVYSRANSCAFRSFKYLSLFISLPMSSLSYAGPAQGVLIYSRPVPTQPAQVRGEPAPPDQVVLAGPGSSWGDSVGPLTVMSDSEAALIGSPLEKGLAPLGEQRGQFTSFDEAGSSHGTAASSGGQGAQQVGSALAPMLGALSTSGQALGSALAAASGGGR